MYRSFTNDTDEIAEIRRGLDSVNFGIAVWDSALTLVACSRKYLTHVGFPEAMGRPGTPLVDFIRFNAERGEYGPGPVEPLVKKRLRILVEKPEFSFERARPDGSILEIHHCRVAGGGLVTTYTDITPRKKAQRQLREREKQYRGLIESSVQGICIRKDRRIVYANEALAKIFGYSRAELATMDAYDLVAADHAKRLREAERQAHVASIELKGRRRDGATIWYQAAGSDIEWEGGPARLIACIDITGRRHAAAALKKSEASLRNAQRIAHIGNFDWDIAKGSVYRSPEIFRLFGVAKEDFGDSFGAYLSFVHPDDRAVVTAVVQGTGHREKTYDIEYRIVRPSGEIRFVHEEGEFTFAADGEPAAASGTVRDITDRRRAEAALQASEKKYWNMIDTANEGFWHVDSRFRISEVNETLCGMLGYSNRELVGRRPETLLHDEAGQPGFERLMRQYMETREIIRGWEGEFRKKDGTAIDVRISGTTLWDDQGRPTGRFGFISDITEQKQREAQLRQAQKMDAVGQLTGGVAHDFNNILAVVLGNLELIRDKLGGDGEIGRWLDNAIRGSRRGGNLTQRLLAFSRQQVLAPSAIDLNEVIATTTELLRQTLGEQITIANPATEGLWLCRADRSQVQDALLNLALNARDAMPGGGTLTIGTANICLNGEEAAEQIGLTPGDYVLLRVSDSGEGIAPDIQDRIFEPFFTTKDIDRGSGLGLSIIFGFVKQSGGHMTVESLPETGTTFSIFLPRATEVPVVSGGTKEASDQRPGARGESVVLVEDDPDLRNLVLAQLESLGYRVRDAGSGAEALELLEAGQAVDLLLSDVVLPGGMNGPAIAEKFRQRMPGIKTVFMSGYPERALGVDVSLDGGHGFLQKPFRKKDLADKIRAALDPAP